MVDVTTRSRIKEILEDEIRRFASARHVGRLDVTAETATRQAEERILAEFPSTPEETIRALIFEIQREAAMDGEQKRLEEKVRANAVAKGARVRVTIDEAKYLWADADDPDIKALRDHQAARRLDTPEGSA